jgi:hypothetical protein
MPMMRCPQCGRVADGKMCFACGYEWPAGGAQAPSVPRTATPQVPPASPAPVAPSAPPTASPAAIPPAGARPASGSSAAIVAPPSARPAPPSPTSAPGSSPAIVSPLAAGPAPSPFAGPAAPPTTPSPSPAASRSSPAFAAPTPGFNPFTPTPPPQQSPPGAPPAPPPLSSLFPPAGAGPAAQRGLTPAQPTSPPFGNAPPVASSNALVFNFAEPPPPDEIVMDVEPDFGIGLKFEAEPDAVPPASPSALSGIFDGIDVVSSPEPSAISDPTQEMGDIFGVKPSPPIDTQALGAEIAAAFNASEPVASAPKLSDRLRTLAERLRAEGRETDADLLVEAITTLSLSEP